MQTLTAPEALKQWREAQVPRLSLDKAADKVGVTAPAWFDWENGNKVPSVDRAEDLERVTDGAVTVAMWAVFSRDIRKERETDREAKKATDKGAA